MALPARGEKGGEEEEEKRKEGGGGVSWGKFYVLCLCHLNILLSQKQPMGYSFITLYMILL